MNLTNNYKEELKVSIRSALDGLHPFKQMNNYEVIDCPQCTNKESYRYYSEFKYGNCYECSYEQGFNYYSTVMGKRVEDYKKILARIDEVLK